MAKNVTESYEMNTCKKIQMPIWIGVKNT